MRVEGKYMEKELQGLSHAELIDMCAKSRDFLAYIDKEYTNVNKTREEK